MAKKDSASGLEERIYTIPLRSEWLKVPRNKRGKTAVNTIKRFLEKHMHASDVKISKKLNESVWRRGIQKPPSRVKVKVSKEKEAVIAKLPNEKEDVKEEKKDIKKGLKERVKEKVEEKKKAVAETKE